MTLISIHIPITWKRRGAHKMIITPKGDSLRTPPVQTRRPDDIMIRALVRSWRWQKDLESGKVATFRDICTRENIDSGSASRFMRLNLLAPDIKASILTGTQPPHITLADLLRVTTEDWEGQRAQLWGRQAEVG
jgi:hypothetical protein